MFFYSVDIYRYVCECVFLEREKNRTLSASNYSNSVFLQQTQVTHLFCLCHMPLCVT